MASAEELKTELVKLFLGRCDSRDIHERARKLAAGIWEAESGETDHMKREYVRLCAEDIRATRAFAAFRASLPTEIDAEWIRELYEEAYNQAGGDEKQ